MNELTLEEKINQALMCYEAYIWKHSFGKIYPVKEQNKWDRKTTIQHLMGLIEQPNQHDSRER